MRILLTAVIVIIIMALGLHQVFSDSDKLIEFQQQTTAGSNQAKENILSQINVDTTGKEKINIITTECKKAFPNKILTNSWLFDMEYSSEQCKIDIINQMTLNI